MDLTCKDRKNGRGMAAPLTALAALLAITIMGGLALAVPQPAMEFYGTVTLHGEAASVGINVSALDPSGVKCGAYIVTAEGHFGLLSCNGDDTQTTADEGADAGEKISFRTNGTPAYAIHGNYSWDSGNFSLMSIIGLKNSSPFLYGCRNASVDEDGSGSSISTDLWNCTYDSDDNISSLNFSVTAQTNSSLISCLVSSNRLVTCNDPSQNANGVSYVRATVSDEDYNWSANISVTVTPVNDSPVFLHNLTTQIGSDGSLLTYDINCSDPDGDTVYYYDNTSLFDINSVTGIINFTPAQSQVGNHSVQITCNDETLDRDGNMTFVINDANNPPTLNSIGNMQARSGFVFARKLTASDPDNNTLTFSDNATIFDIGPATGVINFTPTLAQVGNYSINISVSDGNLSDFEAVNFTVKFGAFCGDGVCTGAESCSTCSTDCGACPSGGSGSAEESGAQGSQTGGDSASGARVTAGRAAQSYRCSEVWKCEEWRECSGGVQRRLCRDTNACGTSLKKPEDSRPCKKDVVQPLPSCSDGIKNQNEEDVDCGGPCQSCNKKLFATLPIPKIGAQLKQAVRQIPLMLILAVMLICSSAMAADQVHLRRIRRLQVKEYREKINQYRPMRKLVYRTILNALFITLVLSAYIYSTSNCGDCIRRNVWMPAGVIAAVPFAVAALISRLEFSEYKRLARERRLGHTHEKQIRHLIKAETKLALEIEEDILKLVKEYATQKAENGFSGFQESIGLLAGLHRSALAYQKPGDKTVSALEEALASSGLKKAAGGSLELKQLRNDAKSLLRALKEADDDVEAEKNFIEGMEEAAANRAVIHSIAASRETSKIYNRLVDAYSELSGKHAREKQDSKTELEDEGRLLTELSRLFEKKEEAEKNQGDGKWVRIYNLLVDLSNHYQKKREAA